MKNDKIFIFAAVLIGLCAIFYYYKTNQLVTAGNTALADINTVTGITANEIANVGATQYATAKTGGNTVGSVYGGTAAAAANTIPPPAANTVTAAVATGGSNKPPLFDFFGLNENNGALKSAEAGIEAAIKSFGKLLL